MGEHVVLCVDRLMAPVVSEPSTRRRESGEVKDVVVVISEEEEDLLVGAVECRICHEEDGVKNMDAPCACRGSLKYAHKTCLQQWVKVKGDLTCEICHEPYKTGDYVLPRADPDETTSESWAMPDIHLDLHDLWRLLEATAQRHFLEAEYDGYDVVDTNGTSYCCSAVLTLMALLLVRRAILVNDGHGSEAAAGTLSIFMARAAGLVFPYYAMVWFINIMLQWRRKQDEAAAASEVAFMLRMARPRSRRFDIAVAPQAPVSRRQGPE